MSDSKPTETKEEFVAKVNKAAELENLKQETVAKKTVLDHKIISSRLDNLEQTERELKLARETSYGALSEQEIKKIVQDNDEYMEASRNPMRFICEDFDDIIPFFRKNVILVGAKTGEGKSTAVANLAYTAISTKDAKTGRSFRTLVITNEEKREDFYNRVTSLARGWHYTNHSKFTQEQRETFSKMIPVLASSGRLTVIDNNHNNLHGMTTTVEGLEAIFHNLIANKEYYDIVIIDYYQNIISSRNNPSLDQYKVQEKFAKLLDDFKNNYPAPIVVMSQLRPMKEKTEEPFQIRIMGSKSIMVPCTLAIEMVIDRANSRTKWVVHKSRYTEAMGKDFYTGYDRGRFVNYTSDFAELVQKRAYEREAKRISNKINKSNGLPDAFEKKDPKTE